MVTEVRQSDHMRQSERISEPVQLPVHDRLRLTESLLRAIEDSVSSLQRLLSEVHKEVDVALREAGEWAGPAELSTLRVEIEQLREGMSSRAVIERAKGMLMQAHELSESQAFDLLSDLSQRRHRKLRDVAADVVSGIVSPRVGAADAEVAAGRLDGTGPQQEVPVGRPRTPPPGSERAATGDREQ